MQVQADNSESPLDQTEIFGKVIKSRTFARSPRLASLLQYLGDASKPGTDRSGLTEQQIGVHVFGRPEDYNPMEDNVVRSSARLLRQKLEDYYREEGSLDAWRISIPKGRYVPKLTPASLPDQPVSPTTETAPPHTRRHWARWLGWTALGASLAATGGLTYRSLSPAFDPLSRLWSKLLDPSRRTIVVLSDTAYVLTQDALETPIPVEEYFNSDSWNRWATRAGQSSRIATLGYRRYTGVVDAEFALQVARRPEAKNVEVLVRFARDLSVQDARGANLLVLGAPHANPWISLLDRDANFRIHLDFSGHTFHVQNKKPRPGEPSRWDAVERRRVYGVTSFLRKPDGDGHALLLEGATIAGTETAKDLVFNPTRFATFLNRLQPNSSAVPHFESVWQTASLSGNAPSAELVASRIAPEL